MSDRENSLNLALIEKELIQEGIKPSGRLWWLEESYQNPGAFWQALKTAQNTFSSVAGKSVPLKQYDFFTDTVTRHQGLTTPAFCWHDTILGRQGISYRELGASAGRQAALWRRMGPWLAALITGVVFGLIHGLSSPIEFLPPLALLGFVLCILRWRTGSIYPCFVLHATNNAIALELGISHKTVEKHRGNVMSKLGVHNLAELIRVALAHGLIPSRPE